MARPLVRTASLALAALAFGACSDSEPGFEYPLDDVLRLNHVQTTGTHNSYHKRPEHDTVPDWDYEHPPLGVQLSEQGVRQFELDIYYNWFDQRFDVQHIPQLDPESTCPLFVDCLRDIKDWSDDNRGHHPIVVLLEPKDPFEADIAADYYQLLSDEILSVWPLDRIVTPALVRGDEPDVLTAVTTVGWPTLGEVRGRILFVLLDTGEHRDHVTSGAAAGEPLLFVDADDSLDQPFAAVALLDDPLAGGTAIADAVSAGFLVRTRAYSAPEPIDPATLPAALDSGAHFISTDFPTDWEVPDGAPSGCNPITAPPECTALAIEDPRFVR